jgi:uncharacterized membrane protein
LPYCCQCGKVVGDHDAFCAVCGARQGPASSLPPASDFLSGISPRTAALICYIPIVGWLAAIVVLASQRFRSDAVVRFHAFQGLYLFVAWLIVDWVVGPLFSFHGFGPPFFHGFGALLKALVIGLWIYMIVKAANNERVKLPILGDLAEKSVSEQR